MQIELFSEYAWEFQSGHKRRTYAKPNLVDLGIHKWPNLYALKAMQK